MRNSRVDKLGRVVIPVNIRKELGITKHTPVSIDMDANRIVISVKEPVCRLCEKRIKPGLTIQLCEECIIKIKKS